MTPFGLLLIVLTAIICFFALLIINHLVIRKMMSQSGVAIHVQKIKDSPKEKEEVAPPPKEEEEPKRKARERVASDIKPSVEGETPKLIHEKGHKAEIRKKIRKNIIQSEIFRRIWS